MQEGRAECTHAARSAGDAPRRGPLHSAAFPVRALFDRYRQTFSGLPRTVWILAACLFVNRFGMMVLPFFELYLTRGRDLAVDDAGRIVALYGAGSIAGIVIGGWLTDRFGPRRVQLTSLVLNGLALQVLGHMQSTWAIAAVWVCASLAGESFRPANGAAISAAVGPEARARAFSLMSLAVCVGLTFGLPLGGFLAELDYQWLFRVDGGTAWLAGLFLWRFGEKDGARAGARRESAMPAATVWRDREFVLVLLLLCTTATVLFQFFGALPVFLEGDLGFSKAGVGKILAVNSALIALLQMPIIRRVESRAALPWIGVGAALICLGYGVNALAHGTAVAVVSVVGWTLGEMLYFPLGAAYASHRAPRGAEGRYMSAYGLSTAVPLLLAPLIGTAVYQHYGPVVLWSGCAAVAFVVGPAFFVLERARQGVRSGGSL